MDSGSALTGYWKTGHGYVAEPPANEHELGRLLLLLSPDINFLHTFTYELLYIDTRPCRRVKPVRQKTFFGGR